jgi:hypothetical protein
MRFSAIETQPSINGCVAACNLTDKLTQREQGFPRILRKCLSPTCYCMCILGKPPSSRAPNDLIVSSRVWNEGMMGMMVGTGSVNKSLILCLTTWYSSASTSRLRHGSLVHGSATARCKNRAVRHGFIHSYSIPNERVEVG